MYQPGASTGRDSTFTPDGRAASIFSTRAASAAGKSPNSTQACAMSRSSGALPCVARSRSSRTSASVSTRKRSGSIWRATRSGSRPASAEAAERALLPREQQQVDQHQQEESELHRIGDRRAQGEAAQHQIMFDERRELARQARREQFGMPAREQQPRRLLEAGGEPAATRAPPVPPARRARR